MNVEVNLSSLGLKLPGNPKALANYLPAVRVGDLLFISGTLPMRDGKLAFSGKLGKDLSVEEGQQAAQLALMNALSVIKQEVGDLNRVARVVKLSGHIASSEGFTQQPAVLNGASDLLVALFEEAGRHARAAVGAAELPLGAPVEIELIVQLKD